MHVGGLCLTLALSCLLIATTLAADTTGSKDERPMTLQPKQQAQESSLSKGQDQKTPEQDASDELSGDLMENLERVHLGTNGADEKNEPATDDSGSDEAGSTANTRAFRGEERAQERGGHLS